jgi:hypothetical protein
MLGSSTSGGGPSASAAAIDQSEARSGIEKKNGERQSGQADERKRQISNGDIPRQSIKQTSDGDIPTIKQEE